VHGRGMKEEDKGENVFLPFPWVQKEAYCSLFRYFSYMDVFAFNPYGF